MLTAFPVSPCTGAIASFAAGYLKIRWALWSALVIGVVTAIQAGLLLLMNTTGNIWVCYTAYVLFRGSYQFLVPIAMCVVLPALVGRALGCLCGLLAGLVLNPSSSLSFQIATSLSKELCALVFGVNTFFGTVLKTVITIIVADKRGLGLSVHPQVGRGWGAPRRTGSRSGTGLSAEPLSCSSTSTLATFHCWHWSTC